MKYGRIERERRFLLARFPGGEKVVRVRRIEDRYIDGTRLRLRKVSEDGGLAVYKLTQKIPARSDGAQQGFLTTMYLTEEEYGVLARLTARSLVKLRHSVPPFGIDVFAGALEGLILAEAEFESASEAEALQVPEWVCREVSDDERFTGGSLARVSEEDVRAWLAEYGVIGA